MLVGYGRVLADLQATDGQIDALNAAGCERVFEESQALVFTSSTPTPDCTL